MFDLKSTGVALLSVEVATGEWTGRGVTAVERVSALVYRVTLLDDIGTLSQLAIFGVDAYALAAPGVVDLTLSSSRNFSAYMVRTYSKGAAVDSAGGGPPPPLGVGFLDLGPVAGLVVLDGSQAREWQLTAIGNVTFSIVNLTPGEKYGLRWINDGAGGWTATWPGSTTVPELLDLQPGRLPLLSTDYAFASKTSSSVEILSIAGGTFRGLVMTNAASAIAGVDAVGVLPSSGFTLRGGIRATSPGFPTFYMEDVTAWLGAIDPAALPTPRSGRWRWQAQGGAPGFLVDEYFENLASPRFVTRCVCNVRIDVNGVGLEGDLSGTDGANRFVRWNALGQGAFFGTAPIARPADVVAFNDLIGGAISNVLQPIPNAAGGSVAAVVAQLNAVVLPMIRDAISSVANKMTGPSATTFRSELRALGLMS